MMLVGGTSMYLGAAIAVSLFATIAPSGVAWMRIAGASAVLLVWVRPGRDAWRWNRIRLAGLFGLITAAMNIAFYEALARLPLGTAVALEFLGPIVVAAAGSRTRRDVIALALAVLGVGLIVDVRWSGTALGVGFALLAALCGAGYIIAGRRVAQRGSGIEDLTTGFAVAAVLTSPLVVTLGPVIAPGANTWWLLLLGLGLGVASTAIPYALDQVILRSVGQARFALLLALLPVTAAVVGLVALRQVPHPPELVGIVAVAAALAVRSPAADRDRDEVTPG